MARAQERGTEGIMNRLVTLLRERTFVARGPLLGVAGMLSTACALATPLGGFASGDDDPSSDLGARDAGQHQEEAVLSPTDAMPIATAVDGGGDDPCTAAVFCDRFERTDVRDGWFSLNEADGGALTIDDAAASRGARSLHMHTAEGTAPRASLTFLSTLDTDHASVAFDMMGLTAPDREVQLVRLSLKATDRHPVLYLAMVPGGFRLAEQVFDGSATSSYHQYVIPNGFKPGVWQRWTMELDASGPSAQGVVTLDGVEVLRKELTNAFARAKLQLDLGALFLRDGTARDMWFDDVALRVHPP